MGYKLFLDDERYPPAPEKEWAICRSFSEFKKVIELHGVPVFISFDHDLGDQVPTGAECASWLIEKDLDAQERGEVFLPVNFDFYVHSMNPVGARNIRENLKSYLAHRQQIYSNKDSIASKASQKESVSTMVHMLEDGKYSVSFADGKMCAFRNGLLWRDLTGDKLIYSMLAEIDSLKIRLATVKTNPAPAQPAEAPVVDLKHIAYDALCEAAGKSKWIPKEYWANDWLADCRDFLINGEKQPTSPDVALLQAKIDELEQLCDETYVAQGADAYNHACSEMERWQKERREQGKDAGTSGSLCDGMGWLYERVRELESTQTDVAELVKALRQCHKALEYIRPFTDIRSVEQVVNAEIKAARALAKYGEKP